MRLAATFFANLKSFGSRMPNPRSLQQRRAARIRNGVRSALGLSSLHGAVAWVIAGYAIYHFELRPELDRRRQQAQSSSSYPRELHHARATPSGSVETDSPR